MTTTEGRELSVNGPAGRLHVREVPGPGEPVLFVHCFAGDTSFWNEQLGHVAGRRLVALDLRGHGQSAEPPDDDYTIPSMAGDVAAVADQLGLRRFVLVAHSMGAAVAGHYAGEHPDRVSGLLLVDPAGDNPRLPREIVDPVRAALATDGYRAAVEQYQRGVLLPGARPGVAERVLGNLARAPRALVVNATLASFDYGVLPALDRYRAAGGRAMTVTADQNQGPLTLHALRPDLPRRHIAGTSHYVAMDDPVAFDRVLDEALASWR